MVEAPTFQDSRRMNGVKLSALSTGRLYPPGNIPGTHLCWRLSQPQDHKAAGKFMSMKNSRDTIGDRTRELPACSAVPHPTASPRTHFIGSSVSDFSAGHAIGSDVKRTKSLLHILSVYRYALLYKLIRQHVSAQFKA